MEAKRKKGHADIPREWLKIGEGGNAGVWKSGDAAIKRLKDNVGTEARLRFRRECDLMAELRERPELKTVPVREVRNRDGADEIVMDVLDGNLERVIDRFRCEPVKAASALLGVVETLAVLSAGERPVHHRDVKPSNILYKGNEQDLYLTDFGCAYLTDDERITPDKRAVGAWAFRPPEYSTGPVENINEKGDVFSLGKVLWSMINGFSETTFPGPIWFLPEYDLRRICPRKGRIAQAMYIIAKCCDIRPDQRPSLEDLKAMLEALVSEESPVEPKISADSLIREQEQEIEYAQRQAVARLFVEHIVDDFGRALVRLYDANPASLLLQVWLEEWNRLQNLTETLIEQVAVHESDAPVMNVLRRQQELITRFYPEGMGGELRFCASFGQMRDVAVRLTIEEGDAGLDAIIEGLSPEVERLPYNQDTIVSFLMRAIDAVGRAS